jgi:repressor LexA
MEASQPAMAEIPMASPGAGPRFEIIEAPEIFSIPPAMMRKKNVSVLHVTGNAMMGDHLHDGDRLILEKRNAPQDGEMVVVRMGNGEAALRRFYREGHRIRLAPPCPTRRTILCHETEIAIEGIVVGILRKYRG